MSLDKIDKAINDFTKSIEKKADYAMSLNSRARCHTLSGHFEEALEDYRVLEGLKDEKAADNIKDVQGYAKQKEAIQTDLINENCVPESVDRAKEIVVHSPFDHASGLFVSNCLLIYRDYQEVMVYTGKLLKVNSEDPDIILVRGKAYIYIDEIDMAKKHLKAGLKAEPEHRGLKTTYKNFKAFTKGRERAEKA
eukprot:UN29729